MPDNYIHCDRFKQRIALWVCAHRYKKGTKRCAGCETGRKVLEKIYQLYNKDKADGNHNDGDQ